MHAARLDSEEIELSLTSRAGVDFTLSLKLHSAVNHTVDWWRVMPREVLITLDKAHAGTYWPHLLQGGAKLPGMGVDWSRWVDERRDGVRWNEQADRPWEWWNPAKRTADDEEDERLWGLSTKDET